MSNIDKDYREIIKAYKQVKNHDLKVSSIICSVCGCMMSKKIDENCVHLLEFIKSVKEKQNDIR